MCDICNWLARAEADAWHSWESEPALVLRGGTTAKVRTENPRKAELRKVALTASDLVRQHADRFHSGSFLAEGQ